MIVGDGISLIYNDDSHCFVFSWLRIQKLCSVLGKVCKNSIVFSENHIYCIGQSKQGSFSELSMSV